MAERPESRAFAILCVLVCLILLVWLVTVLTGHADAAAQSGDWIKTLITGIVGAAGGYAAGRRAR